MTGFLSRVFLVAIVLLLPGRAAAQRVQAFDPERFSPSATPTSTGRLSPRNTGNTSAARPA